LGRWCVGSTLGGIPRTASTEAVEDAQAGYRVRRRAWEWRTVSALGPGLTGQDAGRVYTVPNALSLLRLLLVPVFAYLILSEVDGWALVVLMVSGLTDWLDGFLARRWRQVSRLGALLDPAADRLYILSTLLGLAYRDIIPWWLVAVIVTRDLVLTTTLPVLARHGFGPLPVHFLGKAATFNLLYAFPLILLGEGTGTAAAVAQPVGWAFAWWGTGLYWWAGLLYLRQVRDVVREAEQESAPGPEGSRPARRPGAGGAP
jgi:cardiolipin synthase (CMP-forming)